LEKLGFTLEGTEGKAVYFAGKKWDRLDYVILREEFMGNDKVDRK
jgi:RimJ/RimL family protein N-acetyltransferase